MNVVFSSSFKKSYNKLIKNKPELRINIKNILKKLSIDPFDSQLNVHKLTGRLFGLFACKCGYDCRIIFEIIKMKTIFKNF
jgi:mRNA interferase YafQ